MTNRSFECVGDLADSCWNQFDFLLLRQFSEIGDHLVHYLTPKIIQVRIVENIVG